MNWRKVADNLKRTARVHGTTTSARLAALSAVRRAVVLERVFFFEFARVPKPSGLGSTRWATAAELDELSADPVWQLDDLAPTGAGPLLDRGHRCVLNIVGDRIAGYAWLNPHRLVVPKLRVAIALDRGWGHVYKGFTHPEFRGMRLGNDRYVHWHTHYSGPDKPRFLSDFSFDNASTLARIERSGLELVGTGTYVERGRLSHLRVSGPLGAMPREPIPPNLPHRAH